MSYCTVAEVAQALRVAVTPDNTTALQACVDAAAFEIDDAIDLPVDVTPSFTPGQLALANRVNVLRAVEWWKANDAAIGAVGFDQSGALQVPRSTFSLRHGGTVTPLKAQFGIA